MEELTPEPPQAAKYLMLSDYRSSLLWGSANAALTPEPNAEAEPLLDTLSDPQEQLAALMSEREAATSAAQVAGLDHRIHLLLQHLSNTGSSSAPC